MPDYVKDMLGLPTERERRSRSEPRSPRTSDKRVSSSSKVLSRIENLLSRSDQRVCPLQNIKNNPNPNKTCGQLRLSLKNLHNKRNGSR